MKKINFIKTAIAAICIAAAGFSGTKAYNSANQSETDLLLADNVEALSQGERINFWCVRAEVGNCYAGGSKDIPNAVNINVPGWWP